MVSRLLTPSLYLVIASLSTGWATAGNVTIDDTFPDPQTGNTITYQPSGAWNTATFCQKGPGNCTAVLDASKMERGTWHESTFNANDTPISAAAQFNGTSVYVYCALTLTHIIPPRDSDMSFYIDGIFVGSFQRPGPEDLSGIDYNVLVYSNTTLQHGQHEIEIVNGRVNGPNALMVLDRIVYTTDIEPVAATSQSSSTPTPIQTAPVDMGSNHSLPPGVIIGAALGSLGLIILVTALILFYRYHKRSMEILPEQRTPDTNQVSRFYTEGMGPHLRSNTTPSNTHLFPFPIQSMHAAGFTATRTKTADPPGPYSFPSKQPQHPPRWKVKGDSKKVPLMSSQPSHVGSAGITSSNSQGIHSVSLPNYRPQGPASSSPLSAPQAPPPAYE